MARFSALLDACVLVPVALADTLLRLAEAGLYRPLWSRTILAEVTTAITRIHPDIPRERVDRRLTAMNSAFADANVDGWQGLLDGITLPDPQDRHVVAAALKGRADILVTANVQDFPPAVMEMLDIEVQHPDIFLLNQLDLEPSVVMGRLWEQAAATRNPPLSSHHLLDLLSRSGVPEFAAAARRQHWRLTTPT